MNTKISGETPLALLTVSQFLELQEKKNSNDADNSAKQQNDYTLGYGHGLRCIKELFGVSHATAQRYKDTFLKPAVRQNGRVIVVDKSLALELFDEYNKR